LWKRYEIDYKGKCINSLRKSNNALCERKRKIGIQSILNRNFEKKIKK